MEPLIYDEAERLFLRTQALELRNNRQPCELHTRTQGSTYRGRVLDVNDGGVVFLKEDQSRVIVPISLVEKIVGIPIAWPTALGATAGSGTQF